MDDLEEPLDPLPVVQQRKMGDSKKESAVRKLLGLIPCIVALRCLVYR